MNRVLITGANGCIGNVLVRFLAGAGYDITAMARDESDTDKIKNIENVKIVFGDICDTRRMEAILSASIFHIVIHLAGIVHNPNASLEECMEVNYRATSHLFELSKKYGVKQFIFASTVAVYGEDNEAVLDEDSPVSPQTPYAISKLKAEEYIRNNHDNIIKYTIIRPTTVYGKYDRGNINKLVNIVKKGVVPIVGNGNNRKSFVYVENLVEGILKTFFNEKAYNQTFILSDAKPYTMNQFIKTISAALGKKVIILHLPIRLVLVSLRMLSAGLMLFGKEATFNASSVKKFTTNNVFDISKARKLLNYEPRYSLFYGLQKAFVEHK